MRFRTVLFLGSLFMLCFTIGAWSTPFPAQSVILLNPAGETQSVTGKISAVGDAQFSLDIVKNQKSNTLQFEIDGNTKVEGRLSVGSQAAVEYHQDGDKMIATRVIVTPASGISLY
jgi:hypothetical protein